MHTELEIQTKRCLDTSRSFVVEACAGSGKTWLLASRIIRALIKENGLLPRQILAITFTNAAVEEIRQEIMDRLVEFKNADDAALDRLLKKIDLVPCPDLRQRARELWARVVLATPSILVKTFHGWFTHLERSYSWEAQGTMGMTLCENDEALRDEVWAEFVYDIMSEGMDGNHREDFDKLLKQMGKPDSLKAVFDTVLEHRVAWEVKYNAPPSDESSLSRFIEDFKSTNKPRTLDEIKANDKFMEILKNFIEACKKAKKKNQYSERAQNLLENPTKEKMASFKFTTSEGKMPKTLEGCLNGNSKLWGELVHLENEIRWAVQWQALLEFNQSMAKLGCEYARRFETHRRQRGEFTYADIELAALRATRNKNEAGDPYISDAIRDNDYRHVLIDEFQDTNPVEWMIMKEWLDITGDGEASPTVFIVGDPKQSIYGFKGGDSKLIEEASNYLTRNFNGEKVLFNITRRCSKTVIALADKLFSKSRDKEASIEGYKPHGALKEELQGRVVSLREDAYDNDTPSEETDEGEGNAETEKNEQGKTKLYDPLLPLQSEHTTTAAAREGKRIANYLNEHVLGKIMIEEKNNDGTKRTGGGQGAESAVELQTFQRPCQAGDVMLLYPYHADAEEIAQQLQKAKIECSAPSSKNRLADLECRDITALLHAIYDPYYSLALAHVLRSPIFDVGEEELGKLETIGKGDVAAGSFHGKDKLAKAGISADTIKSLGQIREWRKSYRRNYKPVHELLAKIYHDAEIPACYFRVTPERLHMRIRANLEWLLNFTLEYEGGQHGQPAEFASILDQLRCQKSLKTSESATALAAGKVDLRTIHHAKGLERPVVVISNAQAKGRPEKASGLLVGWGMDKTKGRRLPCHISFMIRKEMHGKAQTEYFNKRAAARKREHETWLYVGITRAKQVVIVSAKPNKQKTLEWHGNVRDAIKGLREDKEDHEILQWGEIDVAPETGGFKREPKKQKKPEVLDKSKVKFVKDEPRTKFRTEGELLHGMIAMLLSGIDCKDQQGRLLGLRDKELKDLRAEAEQMLACEEFAKLLARKKNLYLEWKLPDPDSDRKTIRIDCILETDEGVWIIDFKSAKDPDNKANREQLHRYRDALLQANWPRPNLALVGKGGNFVRID